VDVDVESQMFPQEGTRTLWRWISNITCRAHVS